MCEGLEFIVLQNMVSGDWGPACKAMAYMYPTYTVCETNGWADDVAWQDADLLALGAVMFGVSTRSCQM